MIPIKKIVDELKEYKRILTLSKKPDKEEFIESVKIGLIGIAIIGFIGFLFIIIFSLLLP